MIAIGHREWSFHESRSDGKLSVLAITAALATDSEPEARQPIRKKYVICTTLDLDGNPTPQTFSPLLLTVDDNRNIVLLK